MKDKVKVNTLNLKLVKPLTIELERVKTHPAYPRKDDPKYVWYGKVEFKHGSAIFNFGISREQVLHKVAYDMVFLLREYGDASDKTLTEGAQKFKREIRAYFYNAKECAK